MRTQSNQFGNYDFKTTVFGSRCVGKTAFVVRLLTKRFINEYKENSEFAYTRKTLLNGRNVQLTLLDTDDKAMQIKQFSESCKTSQAVILMFSVIDMPSFMKIQQIAEEYIETVKNNKKQKRPIMCLVASKSDHVRQRIVSTNQASELADRLGCAYFESSSREGAVERVTRVPGCRNSVCSSSGDSGCESDTSGKARLERGKSPGSDRGNYRFEQVEFEAPLNHVHGHHLKNRRTGISAPSPTFLRSKFRKFCKITSITSG